MNNDLSLFQQMTGFSLEAIEKAFSEMTGISLPIVF